MNAAARPREVPVLTEVLAEAPDAALAKVLPAASPEALPDNATPTPAPDLSAWLVQSLPALVHDTLQALQPQFEQQLLDALMPRLMASWDDWQQQARGGVPRRPTDQPQLE